MTSLQMNESVAFYPTFGRRSECGASWDVAIHGSVYQPSDPNIRQRILLAILRRYMRATPLDMQSPIFRNRIAGFLHRNQKGRKISIRIGDEVYSLPNPTARNGQFTGNISLPDEQIEQLTRSGDIENGWLKYEFVDDEGRHFAGRSQLVGAEGVSVISDIDDTIKHTCVYDRREMLSQTFLREMTCVEGMADKYHRWANQSATMHYVSSSPWQLFHALNELWAEETFPPGSVHLRAFGLFSSIISRVFLPMRLPRKRVVIDAIIRSFPQRKFVLVGDSGEKDPEIYGALATHYPEQVKAIFIRDLAARPVTAKRFRYAFGNLAPDVARTFHLVDELPDDIGDIASPATAR